MKPKPRPKQELVAEVIVAITPPGFTFIRITCHSNDAQNFVLENLSDLGWLHDLEIGPMYDLHVHSGYDFQEVLDYINSYNDSPKEGDYVST